MVRPEQDGKLLHAPLRAHTERQRDTTELQFLSFQNSFTILQFSFSRCGKNTVVVWRT